LDFIYDYVSLISPPDKKDEKFVDFVFGQYAIFKSNIPKYNETWPSLFGVYINSLLSAFSDSLTFKGMDAEAKVVRDDIRRFNNANIEQARNNA